jgi:hypothetical protein
LIFADAQWGNPRTTLEIYAKKNYPNLKVIPITREFLDAAETRKLRDHSLKMVPLRLVIFSADQRGSVLMWQANVEREMCGQRTEVVEYPGQIPIVVCRF